MAQPKKKLTPAERKKIEDQVAQLQAALDDQEEAAGAAAAADAAEDVEAEREKLAKLFDRLGLSEEDYDLLAGALATGTEERTRQIVREELAAEEEAGKGGGDGSLGELEDNPDAPAVEPPPEDTPPPPSKHWTEKRVFGKKDEEAS